ncbi:MAG TPA: cyclopropane fatty acyl phospholipid synthase [Rhodothermales bacterium]|nr:cyclopropane fatty acyl phospholipid synthase [Rhodothermales bacterium]
MSSTPETSTHEAVTQTRSTTSRMRDTLQQLFERADVQINGDRPWDIQVHNAALYKRLLSGGSLALGESYMDGWWDCQAIDELVARILRVDLRQAVRRSTRALFYTVMALLTNRQSRSRAFQVGERHYDLGNDLFELMLDRRLVYSCGYWAKAQTLDDAQEAKLDLICRKIQLAPGQHVLDIGCGWGGFIGYAAEHYGARATGITVSREQASYVQERYPGLPIEVQLEDYRDLHGTFDHIVSVGMFEHVGYKNYRTFMEVAHRCLDDDGLFLLHCIARNETGSTTDPWIERYIFPNGITPSLKQIATAAEGLFIVEDVHNFGAFYDKTLMAWHANFKAGWPQIADRYGERFYRMWTYYLLCCAGSFRIRSNSLLQVVLSKHGVPGGYRSVR